MDGMFARTFPWGQAQPTDSEPRDPLPHDLLEWARRVACPAFSVEVLRTGDDLAALEPEWDRLCASLSPRVPFATPLWNILYWRHMRRDRLDVADTLNGFAVRDGAGELVAVAPMMLATRPAHGPLKLRQLRFFGADPNVTEIRGLVCRMEHQVDAVAALERALHDSRAEWDWVHWGGLREGTGESDLPGSLEAESIRSLPDYCLDLPGSWDALRARLPRNIKESLRKCYNSLKRDGHGFRLRVVSRPAEVRAALDTFYALHAARAGLQGTVQHNDAFTDPSARGFLDAYAQVLAARGQLRVFQMVIGGDVVATRIGFLLGRELYLYYSGYLPEWGRYSVMTTLLAESLRWAVGKVDKVNLSVGRDESKLRWRPEEISFLEGIQVSPNLASRIKYSLYHRLAHA